MIKTADWIIDMGPEGGARGGLVVAEGTPEEVAAHPDSHTGEFLAPMLEGRAAQQPRRKAAARRPAAEGARKKAAAKKPAAKRATARKTAER